MSTGILAVRKSEWPVPPFGDNLTLVCTRCHEELWFQKESYKLAELLGDTNALCTTCFEAEEQMGEDYQ